MIACAADNFSTTTKFEYKRVITLRCRSLISNMHSITIAFLCALSVINAYDFEDQAYNRLLVEQLFLSHPRPRRDTQTDCVDHDSCCSQSAIKNYHSNDTIYSKQCLNETKFDWASIHGTLTDEQKILIKCVAECIGKKKGYLNADGELIKSNLIGIIKSKFQTMEWVVPKLDGMFESCIRGNGNPTKEGNQCNDIGLTVGHCIWKEIQLDCPLPEQEDPVKCERLKEYLKQEKRYPPALSIQC